MARNRKKPAVREWPKKIPLGAVIVSTALGIFIGAVAAYTGRGEDRVAQNPRAVATATNEGDALLSRAFTNRLSNIPVAGQGVVSRVLADDNDGTRHQRFILRLGSGQTLLIAHNIDLAPRLSSLKVGDAVSFKGEYVWNAKGGTVHWTHRDPAGRHQPGWLEHKGQRSQ